MATIITQQEINDFIKENGIADLLRLIANASNGAVDSVEQIQTADENTQRDIAVAISTPLNAKQAAKLAAKEKKDAEKAEAKARKEQEKAEAKAKKEQEKAEAKARKDAEKLAAKEAAKAEKLAAKLATKAEKADAKAAPLKDTQENTLELPPSQTHLADNQYDILVIDHHEPSENLHTNQFVQSPADSASGNESD